MTAAVPMMTRATPFSSQRAMVRMSRMPPPSCTGIVSAARIASTALRVARRAGEGAVEIDDMQIFEPLSLEGARLLGGIVVEHRRAVHVALGEAHALAFLEINRGKQNHGRHLRKLAIKR